MRVLRQISQFLAIKTLILNWFMAFYGITINIIPIVNCITICIVRRNIEGDQKKMSPQKRGPQYKKYLLSGLPMLQSLNAALDILCNRKILVISS